MTMAGGSRGPEERAGGPGLAVRRREPELMDSGLLDEDTHRGALRALARVNALSGAAARVWREVRRLAGRGRAIRMLDVACGGGDVALAVAARARRHGVAVEVDGCDVSPIAIAYARERATERGLESAFFTHDALGGPLPRGYDLVCCSLFLHHLDEAGAAALLGELASAARSSVLVQDLLRTRLGYALAGAALRLLTRSPVVHGDGLASVRAAFSLAEVRALLRAARLYDAELTRCWPERFMVLWRRR